MSADLSWLPCLIPLVALAGAALAARAAHGSRVRELQALARLLDRGVAVTTPDPIVGIAACRVEGRLEGRDVTLRFDWERSNHAGLTLLLDAVLGDPRPPAEVEGLLRSYDAAMSLALAGHTLRATLRVTHVRATELRRALDRLVTVARACDRGAPVRLASEVAPDLRCPWCRDALRPDEPARACPRCATAHHEECFRESGCTVLGCGARDGPGRIRT